MTTTTVESRVAAWLDRHTSSTWFASSGERVSGTAVAAHLEAAARILIEDGWSADRPGLDIDAAMAAAALGGAGSRDTSYVATVLMEAVICSATGALAAHHLSWQATEGRTADQVVQLLTDAARYARAYGPQMP